MSRRTPGEPARHEPAVSHVSASRPPMSWGVTHVTSLLTRHVFCFAPVPALSSGQTMQWRDVTRDMRGTSSCPHIRHCCLCRRLFYGDMWPKRQENWDVPVWSTPGARGGNDGAATSSGTSQPPRGCLAGARRGRTCRLCGVMLGCALTVSPCGDIHFRVLVFQKQGDTRYFYCKYSSSGRRDEQPKKDK